MWEIVRAYWLEVGVISPAEAERFTREVEAVLHEVGEAQQGYQSDMNPVERFIPLVLGLLSSGRAHLGNRHDAQTPPAEPERWGWQARADGWVPQGPLVGWVDAQGIYLEPTAAYAALNRLAVESGEPLPTPRTLWKRLGERGVIRSQQRGGRVRYGVGVRIQGTTRDVVQIPGGVLAKTPNSPNMGQNTVLDDTKDVGRKPAVGSSVCPNGEGEVGAYEVEL